MINSGDTAFVLLSAGLVMLMTPGLAFFYGGMVRRKNVLGILMQCFIILCVISIEWVLYGYSLSFAPGSGFWGGFQWFGLSGVGLEPYVDYAATIPHQAFMIYQAMFAIITPALIIGAFVEKTINAISKGAKTGETGDGKIFVLDLNECVRIRTEERGQEAIG